MELRHAIELEPYSAPAYFALALVLESLGQRPGAVEQYRIFLALADQGDTQIDLARRRIAALSP
jgi:Tfp pilus assembly protein PilF